MVEMSSGSTHPLAHIHVACFASDTDRHRQMAPFYASSSEEGMASYSRFLFCICGPAGILVRFSYLYEYRGFLALGGGLVHFSLVPKGITLCKGSVIRIFFVRPANRTCRWTVRPNARCIHIFLLHCKILPPPGVDPCSKMSRLRSSAKT